MTDAAAITGAARGLGRSYAQALAAQGARLLLIDVSGDELERLADDLRQAHGVEVETVIADLSRPEDQARAAERIAAFDQLDLLVNAAGFGAPRPFHLMPAEDHIAMLNVHTASMVRFCRAALPGMLARGRGGIINISSQVEYLFTGSNAMYGGTKSFARIFARHLRAQYGQRGIAVQVLLPGYVRTSFHHSDYYSPEVMAGVPDFLWMEVDDVTAGSLAQLGSRRMICMPGWSHKMTYLLRRSGLLNLRIFRRFIV